ncbi:MAG: NADH-cytochrome b5 reductase [Piccolia ochrophora]|nr:MAG: NADH-cytochrome b5 reductase [Piccolia ochrophora]
MADKHQSRPSSLLAPQYVHGIYIPMGLLLVGTAIVKREWLPYAAVLGALLGGWKVYNNSQQRLSKAIHRRDLFFPLLQRLTGVFSTGVKKVLHPKDFREFALKEKTIISHNVAIYRFSLPSPTSILGLPIGQHISIAAPIPGKKDDVVRSYTPISSDQSPGYFDLLLKSYPTGNISKHMASLQIGQTIKVRGPKGAMVYTPNMVKHFGMIAGGTGITPMLQIVRAIIRGRPRNGGRDTTEVDLIFANVNPEDILLKEDLDQLAKEDDKFRVYYVLNKPPQSWEGGVGFVTVEMMQKHLPAPGPDMKLLICGPPPMVRAMKQATESIGYEKPLKPVSQLGDQVFCF